MVILLIRPPKLIAHPGRFSACLSFNAVLNELNSYAMQREVMAEEMSEKVQGELLRFSQELRSERKRVSFTLALHHQSHVLLL